MKSEKVIIIGAGPAGLAIAGRLHQLGINFKVLEKSEKIANSWHGHYERLHLHTVKQYSHLPHKEFPEHYPTYVSRLDLISYLENYASNFGIEPLFNHEVTKVSKADGETWSIECENGEEFATENIVIASGANNIPNQVKWEGQDLFQGEITHSRNYFNHENYSGKRVLIIGMGNTGAEIALDLAENNIEVSISVRSAVCIVPRDVNGRPVQVTAKLLEKIPFGLGDWLGTQIRKIVIGDLSKYGLKMSKVHPAIQLKETGKTPVIDLGTVDMIKKGKIKILGDLKAFHEKGIIMENGYLESFDSVILATGYSPKIENFNKDFDVELDKFGFPKNAISDKNSGLYFVGFDNYKLGGILGTIFSDSEKVANHISQKLKIEQ